MNIRKWHDVNRRCLVFINLYDLMCVLNECQLQFVLKTDLPGVFIYLLVLMEI